VYVCVSTSRDQPDVLQLAAPPSRSYRSSLIWKVDSSSLIGWIKFCGVTCLWPINLVTQCCQYAEERGTHCHLLHLADGRVHSVVFVPSQVVHFRMVFNWGGRPAHEVEDREREKRLHSSYKTTENGFKNTGWWHSKISTHTVMECS